jgi:diguanylate cyclase (GGDEF)-like protein
MIFVTLCWVLAMLSGLFWARLWTGVLTVLTVASFLWTQGATLADGVGWAQLVALGITPWLLAFQRMRDQRLLRRLHGEEAEHANQLSEAARALLSLQRSTQQLEREIAQITDVYHVTKDTARALHLTELFTASLEIAPRLLHAHAMRLIDLSGNPAQILRAVRRADGRMVMSDTNHLSEMEQAIISRAISTGQPSSAGSEQLRCALPEGVSRVAWAPLWRDQKPIGVLVADELPPEQIQMLSIVANQLSLQLSRIHLYARVEALAITDALTGLFVRNYFLERAGEELTRTTRHQLACTLLMVDLDHFKEKNDTFGHLVGDVVLRDVARLLQQNLRDIDLIARFGGEEFILLLIETTVEQAMPIAQRLKQLVEVHPIRAYDELLTQTISVGSAGFPDDAQTLEQLIERADQALYAAKRSGRNQVVRWSAALARPEERGAAA